MICPLCGSDRQNFVQADDGLIVCAQCNNYGEALRKASIGGVRHDQDKLDWSLVPMQHLEGMVRVLMFGAKKYAAHNWRKGLAYSRVTNSLQRHLNAFNAGETFDPESHLPHTAHILCNALFLAGMEAEHPQLDDRYTTNGGHSAPPVSGKGTNVEPTEDPNGVPRDLHGTGTAADAQASDAPVNKNDRVLH